MSSPFRLCLRIGNDYVASNVHYKDKDSAIKDQKALLNTEVFRGLGRGYGVRVMHWTLFRQLIQDGSGVTTKQLQDNEKRFGREVALRSPLFRKLKVIELALAKEFK